MVYFSHNILSMGIYNITKINHLLQSWPQGTVATPYWLEQQGISRSLQSHYQKSQWIESIGTGAFKRAGSVIGWKGGLYAIQKQLGLSIHVGGLTSFILQNSGHYVRFKETIQLFGTANTKAPLPRWFRDYQWQEEITFYRTNFLPENMALKEYEDKNFNITISTLERAMLECLYLAPQYIDLVECYHLMEGLAGLRPDILQELLAACSSVKVKRLFLYMAEKASHTWLQYLDTKSVDIGKGKRSLVKNGIYNSKYAITLTKELTYI
ncbi:MAG: type IV toxin-antitoxin system AbiEi family antitoxin [Pseudomonadota bacterium]